MKTIHSFTIDHDEHGEGFYLSTEQGDILTYDLRFVYPNSGDYIPSPAMHTIEHLFATVARNGRLKDDVIYFGPMGCRTGFYLLMREVGLVEAKTYTVECIEKCLTLDTIPGNTRRECGNYLEHDLVEAKVRLSKYLEVLQKNGEIVQKE